MNISQAPRFIQWKAGVEFRLFEFQLTQSQANTGPSQETKVQAQPTAQRQPWTVPAYTEPMWPDINKQLQDRLGILPTNSLMEQGNKETTELVPGSIATSKNAPPNMILPYQENNGPKQHTEVEAFMRTRPGGPVQTAKAEMKTNERRVSTFLQKKSIASTQGQDALVALGNMVATKEGRNKESAFTTPSKKRKGGKGMKQHTQVKKKQVSNAEKTINTVSPEVDRNKTKPECKFGCRHGGLVELLQMVPSNTKHSLEPGNYFDDKSCLDCEQPIVELFQQSKRKALFYYCPEDWNAAELEDNNTQLAAKSCDCILCITCYFQRETKKTEQIGTTRRSSGRERKQTTA